MSTSPNFLFGRRWKIDIYSGGQQTTVSSDGDGEALRCVFNVEHIGYSAFWFATLEIYNAETATINVQQGDRVVISAGYQQNFAVIWDGPVFQPLWERENGTDFKTTLRCIFGLDKFTRNFVSANVGAFATQDQIIRIAAAQAMTKITVGSLPDASKFKGGTSPLPEILFGPPAKYFENIARDPNNKMQWWHGFDGLHVGSILSTEGQDVAITYTPQTGLIGTPQQIPGQSVSNGQSGTVGTPMPTMGGITFNVQLDPRVEVLYPAMKVKIDNASIKAMLRQLGQLPSFLDESGTYNVAKVRHYGDTRGGEGSPWCTEITGFLSTGDTAALLSGATSNADPAQP